MSTSALFQQLQLNRRRRIQQTIQAAWGLEQLHPRQRLLAL